MDKFSTIVGRTGFDTQLAEHLASNVTVEAYVATEVEALAVGRGVLAGISGWDGGPVTLLDESVDAYPIENWNGDVSTIIGWEIEGYGGTDLYYTEDDDA